MQKNAINIKYDQRTYYKNINCGSRRNETTFWKMFFVVFWMNHYWFGVL